MIILEKEEWERLQSHIRLSEKLSLRSKNSHNNRTFGKDKDLPYLAIKQKYENSK